MGMDALASLPDSQFTQPFDCVDPLQGVSGILKETYEEVMKNE
jgi:hypothetical protein